MQTAAQWLADRLAFAAGRVVPTKGHPVVRAPAYTIPASHPAITAATAALEAIYPGRPVLLTCMGGTLPATDLFERVLGAKTLFFWFSTADENLHAPNEFMRIRRLREGYAPGRCSGGCSPPGYDYAIVQGEKVEMSEAGAGAGDATEFAERMLRTMNEAALALMVSVGHRTRLFDVMAAMPAATSAEIASRASLDERYVREWLAAMTTGRIVEHAGVAGTYWLPAEHAAWLTRAAGMQNLATGMQYIGLMAAVEDQIVDCFRRGGGVPYSAFPRFQAVMAEDSGAVHDATLIDVT